MRGNFIKGLIVGSVIGASLGAMAGPELVKGRTRKRIMRAGRQLIRRSGNIISDVVDLLR